MTKYMAQKNSRVRKIFVRDSGEKGCANFMGAWKKAFFLQEKTHVHIIPCFRGGGSADFIFMGAGIFLNMAPKLSSLHYFEAFWIIVCQDFGSYLGAGVIRAFLIAIGQKIRQY